jgi:hypothetical protein
MYDPEAIDGMTAQDCERKAYRWLTDTDLATADDSEIRTAQVWATLAVSKRLRNLPDTL